jgi:hypothetical protein
MRRLITYAAGVIAVGGGVFQIVVNARLRK